MVIMQAALVDAARERFQINASRVVRARTFCDQLGDALLHDVIELLRLCRVIDEFPGQCTVCAYTLGS